MTVSSDYAPHEYHPAGDMLAEAIPWQFLTADHVRVTHVADATGVRTVLAQGSNYTVGGSGPAGTGTVTAAAAWPDDDLFLIERVTPAEQEAEIVAHQPLPASDVVRELDRGALRAQELAEGLGRTLSVRSGEVALPLGPVEPGEVVGRVGDEFRGVENSAVGAENAAARAASSADLSGERAAEALAHREAAQLAAVQSSETKGAVEEIAAEVEAMADAIPLTNTIYPDEPTGRAAVADNAIFLAIGVDSSSVIDLWKRVDGASSTLLRAYPSLAALAEEITARLGGMELTEDATAVVNGQQPVFTWEQEAADGMIYELVSLLLNGSFQSGPLDNFVLDRIGELRFTIDDIPNRRLIIDMEASDGIVYELAAIDGLGQLIGAGGGGGGGGSTRRARLHPTLGQSLDDAVDSVPALSTTADAFGSMAFSRGLNIWRFNDNPNNPELHSTNDYALVALVQSGVERHHSAFAAKLGQMLKQSSTIVAEGYTGGDVSVSFLASIGGSYLTELGPENWGTVDGTRTPGGHWLHILDAVERFPAVAEALGYIPEAAPLRYRQGHSEAGSLKLYRDGLVLTRTQVRDGYASRMVDMAESYADKTEEVFGVRMPILAMSNGTSLLDTALRQASEASDLVLRYATPYLYPSAMNTSNGLSGGAQAWRVWEHDTSDGQRWDGEFLGKALGRWYRGERIAPCHVVSVRKIAADKARVKIWAPRLPVQIETEDMPPIIGRGFACYGSDFDTLAGFLYGAEVVPYSANELDVTFTSAIPAGAHLIVGYSGRLDIAGQTMTALAATTDSADGFDRTRITIAADLEDDLASLMREGVFYVRGTTSGAVAPIRETEFAGNSQFVFEDRERGGPGPFQNGEQIVFERLRNGTNICDSDPEQSLLKWTSGPKAGERFDLRNFLEPCEIPMIGA